MNPRNTAAAAAAAIATLLTAGTLTAGPMTPPAGPVTATSKTLAEVEPRIAINATNTPGDADSVFRITAPGSYYLTGNIQGAAAKSGIEITTNGVSIDLNGFAVLGVFTSLDAIVVVGSRNDIAVSNGSVRGWSGHGLNLSSANGSRVSDVCASANGGDGIHTGATAVLTSCSANSNTGNGITAGTGCTLTGCACGENGGYGLSASSGSTITGCSSHDNAGSGIAAGTGSTVTGSSAYQNGDNGISTSFCVTVTGCSAYYNTGRGINAGTACTISRCSAVTNGEDGIAAGLSCAVLQNTCYINGWNLAGSAGIHIIGNDCRVEGNTCTNSDRGVWVQVPGCIVMKNSCSNNTTNWLIVAGNSVAPIVQSSSSSNGAQISGSTYAGSLGTTDPNANFSY